VAKSGDITFRERWWKQIQDDPEVTGGLLLVALVFSHVARVDGTRALISNERLAQILGVSDRMVRIHTQKLIKELSYLSVAERGHWRGDGKAVANVYNLELPRNATDSQQETQTSRRDVGSPQETQTSGR
jgi:hypothetical protein